MKDTLYRLLAKAAVIRKRYLLAAVLLGFAAFGSAGTLSDSISEIIELLLRREQSQLERLDEAGSGDESFLARSS